MSLRPSFKLTLPVVAIALLIALAAWPGVRPQTAEATVNSISGNQLGEDNDNIAITVTGTQTSGDLDVTTDSDEVFTLTSCTSGGSCAGSVTGSPGTTVTLDTNAVGAATYTLVLSMALNCTDVEEITVTATDDDNTRSLRVICIQDDTGRVIVEKQSDGSGSYTFDWDTESSGDECALFVEGSFVEFDDNGSFDLEDNEEAEFFCEGSVDALVVDERDDGDFSEIDDCDEGDAGVDDISGSSVQFDPGDLNGGTLRCQWDNFGAVATATAVSGPVTSVVVAAANITSCGGTTAVQVTLRNASGGPAPAGTSITATSSAGGTFQPSSTLTGNFPFSFATFLYQAPPTFNGIATITVRTSNNVTGVVNIQVICTTAPAPQPTVSPLKPPSAGDGGLLGGGGSGGGFGPYLPSTFAVTVAALVMGATLVSRRREADAVAVTAAPEQARYARTQAPSRHGGYAILASLALTGLALLLKRPRR